MNTNQAIIKQIPTFKFLFAENIIFVIYHFYSRGEQKVPERLDVFCICIYLLASSAELDQLSFK